MPLLRQFSISRIYLDSLVRVRICARVRAGHRELLSATEAVGGREGGVVVVDISVGIRYSRILLACECERGKFTSRRRRSAVSRHFRRRRLYDRRIYTIVGSYTRKLLTCAVCTYVRRRVCRYAAREKKLDELRERLRRGVE